MHAPSGTLSTKIESVQRRAAMFVTNNYNITSSVTGMIDKLEWDSLRQRRIRARAAIMYWNVKTLLP